MSDRILNDKDPEKFQQDVGNPSDPENLELPRNLAIDPEIEKQVIKKIDWNVLPILFILYLLAFLDRSNIGNANAAGMSKDINISDAQYTWFLTIFYISYILFQWQAICWKLVPPNIWGASMVLGWGVVSSCLAAIQNWSGGMALRFLMGIFEAGYGPGVPYLLSFFYLRREVGSRAGIFLAAAPLANSFSGALAYGITSARHTAIAPWRILFLVEGLPCIAMAPLVYLLLPTSPATARFLTADERSIANARALHQTGSSHRIGGTTKLDFRAVAATLLDAKAWLTALMYFSCNVAFSSISVFLPTIIADMGFAAADAQGLAAPPFFVAFCATVATTWLADRSGQRAATLLCTTLAGGAGYLVLATGRSVGARYAGCVLAAAGIFPTIANILPWVTNNQGSDSARGAAIVLLNFIGQCGPLLGTRLYPASQKPYYVRGHSICAAFMFFTTLLVLSLRLLLVWENRKLDRKYGSVTEQRLRLEEEKAQRTGGVAAENHGDGHLGLENHGPMFRYIL